MENKSVTQIPHLIHYCWFGDNALSAAAQHSLQSWQRFAPHYEIRQWNEKNSPIHECAFVRGAYQAGKWAFVSDYVRFWALYHFGGIYMDVSSTLIKDINPLLKYAPFSACEVTAHHIASANPGLILCSAPHDKVVGQVLDIYHHLSFENDEHFLMQHTVNQIFSEILERDGFCTKDMTQHIGNWTIFSSEYFDPVYGFGGFHITKNTYSTHWSTASWCDPVQQTKREIQYRISPFVGLRLGQIIGRVIGEIKHNGMSGMKRLLDKQK